MRRARDGRALFSSRQRAQLKRLARRQPRTVGWELTHWSTRSLALAAVEQDLVPEIHAATVGRLLQAAELQPHLWRTWKTTVWDDEAVARAIKILWYYERVESLWQRGEVARSVALDEKPSLQVLEPIAPGQRMRPGQIERREFEYRRHGTVNLLTGLTLYTGRIWAECLERNDGAHFRPALRRFLHPYDWARRVHLVMDGGASHTSGDTQACLAELRPRVQVLLTPADASWLNQAELLLDAFSARYLHRDSRPTHQAMIDHILKSRVEYNAYFAHPFAWRWSVQQFQFWLNNTPGLIRCRNSAAGH
jgi:DDE superfamily endonuclease